MGHIEVGGRSYVSYEDRGLVTWGILRQGVDHRDRGWVTWFILR